MEALPIVSAGEFLEHAIYNEERNLWYRNGDDTRVKVFERGSKIPAVFEGVRAATYIEAFTLLYGGAPLVKQEPTYPPKAEVFN